MSTRYKKRTLRNLRISEYVHICETAPNCLECPLYDGEDKYNYCLVYGPLQKIKDRYHKIIWIKYKYKGKK